MSIRLPPNYCQYVDGTCVEDFRKYKPFDGFFLYPAQPTTIAATVAQAATRLAELEPGLTWRTWRSMDPPGRVIFCEVCKNMRFAASVTADVTTLNFNLLFELGYALALGLPVIPIRDTSYIQDKRLFAELGTLDTLGYLDFVNSEALAQDIRRLHPAASRLMKPIEMNREQPIFFVRAPFMIDGDITLLSGLKKSRIHFRTYDPKEATSLSLHDANREVSSSAGVMLHLLDQNRGGATVHNARCALLAGMAMGYGKCVLMAQEGAEVIHAIDFRDIIKSYSVAEQTKGLLIPFLEDVMEAIQSTSKTTPKYSPGRLERVYLGQSAAENEIRDLPSYFVPSGPYESAKRGDVRIVAGRKGSGKTAIFYRVRESYWASRKQLVLDLKPEGYQFVRLKETVLSRLTPGFQEHILTALWHYLLLLELAHKIVVRDASKFLVSHPELRDVVGEIESRYLAERTGAENEDLSERLLTVVTRIGDRFGKKGNVSTTDDIAGLLYEGPVQALEGCLKQYLAHKDQVWLLVDNLDKSWPIRGADSTDILMLRSLLEATRKIQREFERLDVEFKVVVFIRDDIYNLLIEQTPDRGKENAATLVWDDPEFFRQIIGRRLATNAELPDNLDESWPVVFDALVQGEASFDYMLSRTLLRPRDMIKFVQKSLGVALNRGHERVLADDVLQAEKGHSEEMLQELYYEVKDTFPSYPDVLYHFVGCGHVITPTALETILTKAGVDSADVERVTELLMWYGFLGVKRNVAEEVYSYQEGGDVRKLLAVRGTGPFVVHPAFRTALA